MKNNNNSPSFDKIVEFHQPFELSDWIINREEPDEITQEYREVIAKHGMISPDYEDLAS